MVRIGFPCLCLKSHEGIYFICPIVCIVEVIKVKPEVSNTIVRKITDTETFNEHNSLFINKQTCITHRDELTFEIPSQTRYLFYLNDLIKFSKINNL